MGDPVSEIFRGRPRHMIALFLSLMYGPLPFHCFRVTRKLWIRPVGLIRNPGLHGEAVRRCVTMWMGSFHLDLLAREAAQLNRLPPVMVFR